ncbi:MAG: hypothetical protein GKR89_00275 [Candidatus Latescibacteria bacterium]|nr:hypothetical protein [Candidatus Latescibacterota bacterium]
MTTALVEATRLKTVCSQILQSAGIAADDADFTAHTLVEADLRGVHSHGCLRLSRYVRELRQGITNTQPQIRTLAEGPGFARVDGDGALGPLVGRYAMELCLEKAQHAGSATVTASGSRHFGTAGTYCLMARERDFIGLAMTVASPRLAPTGGIQPLFGNNPISLSVPGDQDFPLLIDLAMGSIAAGRLELAAGEKQELAPGLARDAQGLPTTDPEIALKGSIVPIGEHKGYGLTLLIEILAGLLSGAPYFGVEREQVAQHTREKGIGHFFMAIDPARFMPLAQFKAAIAGMVAHTKTSPPMPGVEEILLPGEMEERLRRQRLAAGIPLAASTAAAVDQLAQTCGTSLQGETP